MHGHIWETVSLCRYGSLCSTFRQCWWENCKIIRGVAVALVNIYVCIYKNQRCRCANRRGRIAEEIQAKMIIFWGGDIWALLGSTSWKNPYPIRPLTTARFLCHCIHIWLWLPLLNDCLNCLVWLHACLFCLLILPDLLTMTAWPHCLLACLQSTWLDHLNYKPGN